MFAAYETAGSWDALGWWKWILIQLSLTHEGVFGAWYSSFLFALAGLLLAFRTVVAIATKEGLLRVGLWLAPTGLLLLLSFDELSSLRERMFLDNTAGAGEAFQSPVPLILPAIPFIALIVLGLLRKAGRCVSPAVWPAILGIWCLSTIGAFERLEQSDDFADRSFLQGLLAAVFEEGTELIGITFILVAALVVVLTVSTSDLRKANELILRHCVVFGFVIAMGLILVPIGIDGFFGRHPQNDQIGMPQWWTGSIAAAWLAVTALIIRTKTGLYSARVAAAILAGSPGLLCIFYGSDGFNWAHAIRGAKLDLAARLLLASGLLVPAILIGVMLSIRASFASFFTAAAGVFLVIGEGVPQWYEVGALAVASVLFMRFYRNELAARETDIGLLSSKTLMGSSPAQSLSRNVRADWAVADIPLLISVFCLS